MESSDTELEAPFGEEVELEIGDVLDLHAFRPRDVKAVTEAYLSEARKKRIRFVRIIHGKGIGVQREIVRSLLNELDYVKGYKSGDEFSGGWGATVAELEPER